jgi:adenine-specific DNA-methyltransferase
MAKNKLQKLELTWIGKGEDPKLEPRIFIENPGYSYGDPKSENMLIHGDNLLALKALEHEYAGKVKCIYIDPPFNVDAAGVPYNDNIEHSIWLGLMRSCLSFLNKLLSKDGSIWISISDMITPITT